MKVMIFSHQHHPIPSKQQNNRTNKPPLALSMNYSGKSFSVLPPSGSYFNCQSPNLLSEMFKDVLPIIFDFLGKKELGVMKLANKGFIQIVDAALMKRDPLHNQKLADYRQTQKNERIKNAFAHALALVTLPITVPLLTSLTIASGALAIPCLFCGACFCDDYQDRHQKQACAECSCAPAVKSSEILIRLCQFAFFKKSSSD